jgi:3-methylcrotonyl-CoA carboxylase alpha subunit
LRLFRKILIANRGEIAVRVARTCRAMGVPCVAVYSEADRGAPHLLEADEAVFIGPPEPRDSYLNIDAIVSAIGRTGADAVHPGYGFLSQNPDFADAVERAGATFIGPPARVHRAMGDKKAARRLMSAAGIPVIPGYDGDDQKDDALLSHAKRIGWPVLIKPSRGGGGKGMRVVSRPEEFPPALAASRREAQAAFGDEVIVLERFLDKPRHIEIQILADAEGRILHLFERECSIQRRHQKILEETPSPGLGRETLRALSEAGLEAARAVSYVNAGTVEFLLDPQGLFYFLEMNTRLQVEHAVTEAVTALDLVRIQIEIARGRALPFAQEDVLPRGHALECRLYAEDSEKGDLPSSGRILHLKAPEGPGVRFDGGIAEGTEVSVYYDPMLAKIVTWGRDRSESIERMGAALGGTVVLGVATNLARLRALLGHPAFLRGELHTRFIEEHEKELSVPTSPPDEALAAAAAALTLSRRAEKSPTDPWDGIGSWRLS